MKKYLYHTPVLLNETIEYLVVDKNEIYVDGTLGGGGHTEAILKIGNTKVIGIDLDDDALSEVKNRLAEYKERIKIVKENFKNIKTVLSQIGIDKVGGILLDLGVSSYQLDEPEKGFSYRADAPLDMRMNRNQNKSAQTVINQYEEKDLADIFWRYGEERHSRKIARAISICRTKHKIETTRQFCSIIEAVVGTQFLNKTLARIFQAVRIEVNNEIENLKNSLNDCVDVLKTGGRFAVISYHSLEDRLVKETFREKSAVEIASGHKLVAPTPIQPILKLISKKPIIASDEEIKLNPRARSAKLRVAEKV